MVALKAINLANQDDVILYLEGISKEYNNCPPLKNLLAVALARCLKSDVRFIRKIDNLPENAPEWMKTKWKSEIFYEFIPSQVLDIKVKHVADWICSSYLNSEQWLKKIDHVGRPLKLLKFGSIEQACAEADKYTKKRIQKYAVANDKNASFSYELNHGDIEIEKSLDDGYKIVRIINKIAAAREAFFMQHCVANGSYDWIFSSYSSNGLYSLRDSKNIPHVTFEVDFINKAMRQCVGKQNTWPLPEYLKKVMPFITENLGLSLHLVFKDSVLLQDGSIMELDHLPDNFIFEGHLDIRKRYYFECPENFHVKGNFIFSSAQHHFISKTISVEGTFIEETIYTPDKILFRYYDKDFSRIVSEQWCKMDKYNKFHLHREDGPAKIEYNPKSGEILRVQFYRDGKVCAAF